MSLHHITTREKIIVMLAVMSGLLLVALDQTIVSTALGAIVGEFNSYSSLGFVVTAYMLTSTVTVPIAGKLSDMYGRKVIMMIGVILFALASLWTGLAHNMTALIVARAVQGIGGGMIMANAFTIVGDLFSPRERSKWQGFIGATFGLSSVMGPLLGGWLTDGQRIFGLTTDWRWNFYINIPIAIVAAIVIARFCPVIKHDGEHKPDYAGAAAISIALTSIILAVDNTEVVFRSLIESGTLSLSFIKGSLWAVAAVASAIFITIETRAKQPILPLSFFRNRTYTHMITAMLFFGAAFLASILYLTQFNQQVYNASASQAGLMLLPMVAGMTITSITTGQIVSKVGRYKPFMVTGFTIGTVAIASLLTLNVDSPYWHEAIMMSFIGIGLGMSMPLLNLAVQNEFEQRNLGAATSSIQLFRGLGSTVGTALLSGILTVGIISALGQPEKIPYIKTLSEQPESAQMVRGELNADKLLAINSEKGMIARQAEMSLSKNQSMPEEARSSVLSELRSQQNAFGDKLTHAFSSSLHRVFLVSAVLMAIGLLAVATAPNRELRSGSSITPAE